MATAAAPAGTRSEYFHSEEERRLARDFDKLRAQLMSLLEAMNLSARQTEAGRQLIKSLTYAAQQRLYEQLRSRG